MHYLCQGLTQSPFFVTLISMFKAIKTPLIFFFVLMFSSSFAAAKDKVYSELLEYANGFKWYEVRMAEKEKLLKKSNDDQKKIEIRKEINILENNKNELYFQFLEKATGGQIFSGGQGPQTKKKNFGDQVQDLLSPLIQGLRRISERPRKIEKFKGDLETIEARIVNNTQALPKLKALLKTKNKKIVRLLRLSINQLEEELIDLKVEKKTKKGLLDRLLGEKRGPFDSSRRAAKNFFKTKGINIIIGLFTMSVFFFTLYFLRKTLFRFIFRNEIFTPMLRAIKGAYIALNFFLTMMVGIITFYMLNDWVLVTAFFILIVGILWPLKKFIPQFLKEIRLISNLGSVREGEKIIVNDLPWEVKSLGPYCLLHNPLLDGGTMRMAASDLLHLYSRKIVPDEVWFPTVVGDWCLNSDGLYGQVQFQTPEHVCLKKAGGSIAFIKTSEFYSDTILNYSLGFSVRAVVGINYSHQEQSTSLILGNLKKSICHQLREDPTLGTQIEEVVVEFHEAGSSSLNYFIRVSCAGSLAPQKEYMERKIQRLFVDFCSSEKLNIPFEHLNVILSKDSETLHE
jgi:hypothetical protein